MSQVELIVAGVMPLLASGLIAFIHRLSRKPGDTPSDGMEKQTLALMLLPVLIGFGFLLLARLAPSIMTSTLPTDAGPEGGESGWEVIRQTAFVSQSKMNWLKLTLNGVMWGYAIFAGLAAVRLMAMQIRLWHVARKAVRSDRAEVRMTEAQVPAYAWGRAVILPKGLAAHLSEKQLAMVIAHERAHLARRDTLYFAVLSWIDAVFWFNPFLRHQTKRCRLAAELACDALVTQANPEMRQVYAASLLLALKHSAGNALQCVPAVISPSNSGDFKMRLVEIMRASGAGRKRIAWLAQIMAVALVLPLAAGQYMLSQNPAQASITTVVGGAVAEAHLFSVRPAKGDITSPYGPRTNPLDGQPQVHGGIDFRGAVGDPVYAPAAGHVVTVKKDEWNGLYLEIDRGGGYVSRYTHLNKLTVGDTATVSAGQQIAEIGDSGKATGAHLHFAVFKDGQPVDPATLLP